MINNLVFVIIFMLGFSLIFLGKTLIKMVIGLNIMESSVFFWVISISKNGGFSPIIQPGINVELYNDPIPQALLLTGIVIGASTTALLLTLIIDLGKFQGDIYPEEIKGLND